MGSRKLAGGFHSREPERWTGPQTPRRREAASHHPRPFHLIEQPIEGA